MDQSLQKARQERMKPYRPIAALYNSPNCRAAAFSVNGSSETRYLGIRLALLHA
jgi:hypothetical protein